MFPSPKIHYSLLHGSNFGLFRSTTIRFQDIRLLKIGKIKKCTKLPHTDVEHLAVFLVYPKTVYKYFAANYYEYNPTFCFQCGRSNGTHVGACDTVALRPNGLNLGRARGWGGVAFAVHRIFFYLGPYKVIGGSLSALTSFHNERLHKVVL